MKRNISLCTLRRLALVLVLVAPGASLSAEQTADPRQLVALPPMMQEHMLANMRDHLRALDEILTALAAAQFDRAAEIAEQRLGMSSLDRHGAGHMAPLMPEGMRNAGTEMHRAASRFALAASEGDLRHAYAELRPITAACVACHAGYRIR